MARIRIPDILAKAGLGAVKPKPELALAAAQSVLPEMISVTPVAAADTPAPAAPLSSSTHHHEPSGGRKTPILPSRLRRYPAALAAVGLLIIGVPVIRLGGDYWASKHIHQPAKAAAAPLPARPIAGFNTTIPATEFQSKLNAVTHQPITLAVGTNKVLVDSDIIKSWLQITENKQKTEYYVHVNETVIGTSLIKLATQYTSAPVDQVTASEDGTKRVVVSGQDGTSLSDPSTLKTQAKQTAKSVLDAKGMNFSTGLKTLPFHAVTPAAFDKLILVDVTTKKMWLFQNGKQIRTYLVSAGKPSTPTPLGEFHVYAKFSVQDMRGDNPDGTPYFQPAVPWVSYFSDGSAVHGVYWHPLSWFGAINSSHGCVGLPVDEAEWVFNWDSIGTTVITHA